MPVSRPPHLARQVAVPPHITPVPPPLPPGAPRAPGPWLLALEGRAPLEFMVGQLARPWLRQLPRGDGHAVIVYPGLGANDASTAPLRAFLAEQGYEVHRWGQGFNLGPREGVLDALRAQLRSVHAQSRRPVSLVGWSLGGLYARELAKEMPEAVRCVITLGSPFSAPPQATNAWRFFEWVSGQAAHEHEMLGQLHEAPPVPTTSILSRTDGIVAWEASLNGHEAHTENIELHASHLGIGMNPLALYVVADRLRQQPATWQRFDPQGAQRWLFRTAHRPPHHLHAQAGTSAPVAAGASVDDAPAPIGDPMPVRVPVSTATPGPVTARRGRRSPR